MDQHVDLFLFLLHIGIHLTTSTFVRKITSPCNVIDVYQPESNLQFIGDDKWKYGCPNNRHIKGVYSSTRNAPFNKIKCCGNESINTYSSEFRDIPIFAKDSATSLTEKWSVECPMHTIITGFRFAQMKSDAPISFTSMRCSVLKDRIFDSNKCEKLMFSSRVNSTIGNSYDQQWQHECLPGYGMVALRFTYESSYIDSAKCCLLKDLILAPGWSSNLLEQNGGFIIDQSNKMFFKPDGQGHLSAYRPPSPGFASDSARLISPGISNLPFCLNLTWVVKPRTNIISLNILRKTKDGIVSVKMLTPGYDARKGLQENTSKSEQIWVYDENSHEIAQIYIDVNIWRGEFILKHFQVDQENQCRADRCENIGNEIIGCKENELCDLYNGYNKCVCKFKRDSQGRCKNKLQPTDGTGKGGRTHEPLQTDPVPRKTSTTTEELQRITTSRPVTEKKEKLVSFPTSPWVYSVAGGICGIVAVVLVLGGCLYYRNTIGLKHGRLNSFEQELAIINRSNATLLSSQFSRESVTTLGTSTRTLFRPFMHDLGNVEHLTPPSRNGSFLSQTANQCVVVDPTTGEPMYTRITRPIPGEHHQTIDEQLPCSRNSTTVAKVISRLETEDLFYDPTSPRRPSCSTLIQPDYGEPDSDNNDEQEVKKFEIPGDDEEELLDELNELTPESIHISTKILGQGAFGLVKQGKLVSVHGTNDVAVKVLKQRSGNEITRNDRIKFYQEAVIMSQFDHINVISLFGVIVGKNPCMVMEHLSRGCLWKYLNKIRRIREREGITEINYELNCFFLKMARDIVSGMEYLAELNFIHRDLAARNILLDSQLNCKISDFGLSRHFLKDDEYYTCHGGQIPVKWTAPEALQFKKYTVQSDVWSYGIVLWEIWSLGLRPYGNWVNDKVLKEVCERAYRLPAPKDVPKLIYRLMIDCWHPDKNNRPTFSQLAFCLNHNNERILGKPPIDEQQSRLQRTRSVTWNIEDEINSAAETVFDDLQNIYCKTE